jgi:hypothetical protein
MINARYSIPAWEWALLSFFMGFIVTLFSYTDPSVLHNVVESLPFEGQVWGPLMMGSAGTVIVGMARNKYSLVRHGAFVSFLLMVFFDFSWWMSSKSGYLSVLAFCSWVTLFWLYKYLASFVRERDQI